MDQEHFDDLTRTLADAGETRRAAVRLLAGGMLGSLAAWLGMADAAEAKAKPKKPKGKSRRKRKSQSERKMHGSLLAQGKGKGKRKKPTRKSPAPPPPSPLPPLPPGCESCNECQMCQDGACVPDPALGGVPCQGSGPHCNYCLNGLCIATEQRPCDDGFCVHRGQCCPGREVRISQCPKASSASQTTAAPGCEVWRGVRLSPTAVRIFAPTAARKCRATCSNGNWTCAGQ